MSLSKNVNPIFPRFSVEEYEHNPTSVKKVNDAALEYLEKLMELLEDKELYIKQQEKKIAASEQIDRMTLMQPFYMIIGTIFFGFGVNYATSSPHDLLGWFLCFLGSAIQLVVIFLGVFVKLQGQKP